MWLKKNNNNQPNESFEKELCSFQQYCKEHGFTDEELREIYKPLLNYVQKKLIRSYLKLLLIFFCFGLFLYALNENETSSWHLSAIGRIGMIKLLPYWNWDKLSGTKCLISNYYFHSERSEKNEFDCNLCEGIDSIQTETDINPKLLKELYLDVNVPVIITDGLRNWNPIRNESYDLIGTILNDERLSETNPCDLSTNMFTPTSYVTIGTLLRKSLKFSKLYFHFQNCNFTAVKQFRLIAGRPYFFRAEIRPVQYSWLLMSSGYKMPYFKTVGLIERITVFGQVEGSYLVRLSPRENCAYDCPVLEIQLEEGEALVFTSLWHLEYKSVDFMKNVAIILETY